MPGFSARILTYILLAGARLAVLSRHKIPLRVGHDAPESIADVLRDLESVLLKCRSGRKHVGEEEPVRLLGFSLNGLQLQHCQERKGPRDLAQRGVRKTRMGPGLHEQDRV